MMASPRQNRTIPNVCLREGGHPKVAYRAMFVALLFLLNKPNGSNIRAINDSIPRFVYTGAGSIGGVHNKNCLYQGAIQYPTPWCYCYIRQLYQMVTDLNRDYRPESRLV